LREIFTVSGQQVRYVSEKEFLYFYLKFCLTFLRSCKKHITCSDAAHAKKTMILLTKYDDYFSLVLFLLTLITRATEVAQLKT
jgi:hypothetical protein